MDESVCVRGERGETQQKETKETKDHVFGQIGTKLYHWSACWRMEGAKASMICCVKRARPSRLPIARRSYWNSGRNLATYWPRSSTMHPPTTAHPEARANSA